MRLALIAGGAEPGRDGIGDHARILAGELQRRGHAAWVLALADPHVREPGSSTSLVDGTEVTALRLPATLSSHRRLTLAQAALDNAQPEAVLFDFSPTQYEGRGLIWPMARDIAALAHGRQRAVLVHEYCLGRESGADLKRRLWGRAQTLGFRRFARSLNGLRIGTTNLLYARMLERDGFAAEILPLFGNIPVLPAPAENWVHARLREAGVAADGGRGFYCAGLFGTLYEGADLASAMPMLQQAARCADGRLAILSIGHVGNGAALWQAWQSRFAGNGERDPVFLALGRREAAEISAFIHGLDIGLSTVSMSLSGKSGTLAAFADHGLPAIVINDSVRYDFLPDSALALPANTLPPTAQTAERLRETPVLPRIPRQRPALAVTADWLERLFG